MVKRIKIILFLLFIFSTNYTNLYSFLREKKIENGNIIEKIEFGKINWTTGVLEIYSKTDLPPIIKDVNKVYNKNSVYVRSKAEARLYAFKQAKKECKRNLFNAVYNIRVKNNLFIKDYFNKIDDLKYKLDGYLSNLKNYKKFYNKDNSVTVKIKMKIWGGNSLLNAIECMDNNVNMITNYNNISEITQTFTSLVIDAQDIKNFYPSLVPEIYDEEGRLIYSGCKIFKAIYRNNGGVKFLGDAGKLPEVSFVDSNSLTVRAIKLKNKTSLVIPIESVRLLFSSKKTLEYLKNGRVIVIIR